MGCECDRLKFLPGTIILLVGFVLSVVGVSSGYWCESDERNTYIGLWGVCFTATVNAIPTEQCFNFREREYVPIVLFICSALCIVCSILTFVASFWSLIAVCQRRKRANKWFKKAGLLAILADVLVVIAVCLYAGSYNSIQYDRIPRWAAPDSLDLAWSYYITCAAAFLLIVGATSNVALAMQSSSIEPGLPPVTSHVPSLFIHPPPSSRIMSPFRIHPRDTDVSPPPFSQSAFSSPRLTNIPNSFTMSHGHY